MTIDEARSRLKDAILPRGGLYELGIRFFSYQPGEFTIGLDGDFDADELEAMAVYMRHNMAEAK